MIGWTWMYFECLVAMLVRNFGSSYYCMYNLCHIVELIVVQIGRRN